ncbi:methyltransferase domain-containing protein [Thermosynechococcus sichuanensis E542]|uniref:Methyltransferase domain-containing protein n=1 Tax=Thermosynechococcus sichuanensis E542 TaxID=2016101 RepID=A0A3B7MDP0_9CYAN|nr:methyltransferase domain-containing protein [Thermosynechococcus vestitus]AXY67715.2 methyltransferase domain-containing protein [Thermosynechococcus vestitus E542]
MKSLIPSLVLKELHPNEIAWLESTFCRFNNQYPSLEELWKLMDEVWDQLNCDPEIFDNRITRFYNHPIWLLNGLFIEHHEISLMYRRIFTKWIVKHSPQRVADYGGGFGTLARMIGQALPSTMVEVIEPYPHPAAVALAAQTANVRYCQDLNGSYDVIIATDVFEHVSDPLGLVFQTAQHLKPAGYYLIANCFYPVIRCHLPQTFHFRFTWNTILENMGLIPIEPVAYGHAFQRNNELSLSNARKLEKESIRLFSFSKNLPNFVNKFLWTLYLKMKLENDNSVEC